MDNDSKENSANNKTIIRRVRQLWRNPISLVGAFLSVVSLIFFLSFQFFELIANSNNPYLGIWEWLVFAPLFVLGGLMMPLGVVLTRWFWIRKDLEVSEVIRYPRVDFSKKLHRKILAFIAIATVVMVPLIGLASSKTVHYSSSSKFCGSGCHDVMQPQYVRYMHSPHARVECADCHIGSGAESMIKAKLNGLRQVISFARGSYSRPIPPAGHFLRPAKETCEECHWAAKQYGSRYLERISYRADEKNTRRETKMLVKVGGGDTESGTASGIHWHMSLKNKIEYVAEDTNLQQISWVKVTDVKTGDVRVYRSDGITGEEPPASGIFRKLDCLDCHNRGAHRVESPIRLVDAAIESGQIDVALPYIKREATAVLVAPYQSNDEGLQKIPERISAFYKSNYPEIFEAKNEQIKKAGESLTTIFRENFFVRMKVNWQTYPDNIGHKTSPGCFRCHDGKHLNSAGVSVSTDCKICHEFLCSPETDGEKSSGEFQHALLLGKGTHAKVSCQQCHNGGEEPTKDCNGACHKLQTQFIAGEQTVFQRFEIEADEMNDEVECEECHLPKRAVTSENIAKECRSCHDDDEDKDYGEMLTKWNEKLETQQTTLEQTFEKLKEAVHKSDQKSSASSNIQAWLSDSQAVVSQLLKAGRVHNYKATKAIYKKLLQEAEQHLGSVSEQK